MGRGACWLGVALAALMVGAPAVLADGGQTISGAPAIAYGQQEFGNTANGSQDSDGLFHSYWGLSVTAGDQVTIDWEVPANAGDDSPELRVFSVGTTDFNVDNTDPAQEEDLNSNSRNELVFSATVTGVMPVDFRSGDCCVGPYDFTARVQHAVSLGLPALTTVPLTGSVSVAVHNPDGAALSDPSLVVYLQIKPFHQPWANIGSAAASVGVAAISYTIPATLAGQHVSVRAVAAGSAYLTQATASEKVLVGSAPISPPPVHHHRHKHHKHKHHHHKHHHRHHHHG